MLAIWFEPFILMLSTDGASQMAIDSIKEIDADYGYWYAIVDDKILKDKFGKQRRFKTKEAALKAAKKVENNLK